MGQGFGLGFAVRTASGHNPLPGSVGNFYWTGAWGTTFWVDPQEKLIAIQMIQVPGGEGGLTGEHFATWFTRRWSVTNKAAVVARPALPT